MAEATAVFVIDSEGKVTQHASLEEATKVSGEKPESFVVSSEEGMKNVPMGLMVEMYNSVHSDTPVKKFVNIGMATSRTFPLLGRLAGAEDAAPKGKGGKKKAASDAAPAEKKERAPKLNKFVLGKDGSLLSFAKVGDARTVAEKNGGTLIVEQGDLLGLSMNQLVALHNQGAEESAQVKKFNSKEKGAEATFPLLTKVATPGEVPEREKRERSNSFAGKTIHLTQVGRDARRRPDTRRTTSWNVLAEKAGKAGKLPYADYLAAGGHPDDMATIVRLGHAEVR